MSTQKRSYELKTRAERQRETRRRIVEATAALHQEVGPARTTVAEIARRAGVQRLTVYNHFPRERELFAACQGHFLASHPPPDFSAALALAEPRARVEAALLALYRSYRSRQAMTGKVLRDRAVVPDLDALMRDTFDAQMEDLARALARPFPARSKRMRAAIALALDFSTWERLEQEGLSDAAGAGLMADLVEIAGGRRR